MDIEQLLRNLKCLENKYQGKQVHTGDLRIDLLASDCIRAIQYLQKELEKANERTAM